MMVENIIFLLASFLAAIAATVAGFGSSTLLIPVAFLFIEPKTAVFLVACFHLFNNIFKVHAFFHRIDKRLALLFGIPSILFAFIGAMLISQIPSDVVRICAAVFLIAYAVFSFLNPHLAIRGTSVNAALGGGLSGFLAGLTGLGGAIRAMFLIAFRLPKEVYVATSAVIAFVIDVTRIPTYLLTDIVQDTSYYVLLPFLVVSAYLGVRAGKGLLLKIDQGLFRKIVLTALLLVGIKLLV